MKALREILHKFFSGPLVCMKLLDPHAAPCSLQLCCTPHGPLGAEMQQVGRGLSLTDKRGRAAMGGFTQDV